MIIEKDPEGRRAQLRQREKDERYVRDAATRCQGAVHVLRKQMIESNTPTDRYRVGYATEQFLWRIVSDLSTLVIHLEYSEDEDDYYLQEDIRRDVEELHKALKRQGQLRKMKNVEGRTPEEIEAIRAKAAEWLDAHEEQQSA
jgi:DNA repair ATPase RecN